MNTTPDPLISIVDDDESVRQALKSLIDSIGFRAEVFGSGEEFLNSAYVLQTDCLIADVRMAGMNGLELQERLNASGSPIPIVFISAHDDKDARVRGLRAGAIAFLQKPFSEDSLLGALSIGLDKT
jgi:FixJ family two-component response regulator